MESLDVNLLLTHWPFVAVAAVLAVLGRVADRVFTREKAYVLANGRVKSHRPFWFWARESLPAHPIAIGLILGFVMPDPEGLHWGRGLIVLYFGGAGVAGLGGWIYMRARLKRFPLPGESVPPDAP